MAVEDLESVSEVVTRLRECLSEWEDAHGSSYMVNMWLHALDHHAQTTGACSQQSPYNDSLPYLPSCIASLGIKVSGKTRLLDVGCLGGYGLYDIVRRLQQESKERPEFVGIDADPDSISLGIALSKIWGGWAKIAFSQCRIEDVDRSLGTFDLVLCRLVLPYTRIDRAMSALRAYTKTDGVLVLQVHSPLYYMDRFVHSLRNPRKMFYYIRPICNGLLFALFGRQLRGRLWQETALSRGVMLRLLRMHGFDSCQVMGHRRKPIYICNVRTGKGG